MVASTPARVRPGGRTARVRRAVLVATEDALVDGGFAGLDVSDIARRAGVGRATVYRRWGSPTELVADLLSDMAAQSLPRARTGSLQGDLRANARLVGRTLADPRQGAVFRAVISAATADARATEALHEFYRVRLDEWAGCITDAIEREEIPVGTDPRQTLAAVAAPLYYRLLLSGQKVDRRAADRAAEAAIAAATAGVFVDPQR